MVQALTKMSHPAELEKVLRGRPIRLMKSRLVLVPFPDLLVSLAISLGFGTISRLAGILGYRCNSGKLGSHSPIKRK